METLRRVCRSQQCIDNHAHNLLTPENDQSRDLLSVTSEAQQDALEDAPFSLSHARARTQLKDLYGCDSDEWAAVKQARSEWLRKTPEKQVYETYFGGTHTILMDDGLDANDVRPFNWHDQWIKGKTKRLVRIEVVAESIIRKHLAPMFTNERPPADGDRELLARDFSRHFYASIKTVMDDEDVVGFKSIICYRSGLEIRDARAGWDADELGFAILQCVDAFVFDPTTKINNKILNDYIVSMTMKELELRSGIGSTKPIQFHTGLGDNDMMLELSNPACMQPFIRAWPTVPIILLHSSYPYTREAGYLATVYKNVYLDLGLVFPMLSKTGQGSVLRQSLELVPTNKLLWSTDGHWFGETYYLANQQFRETLEETLVECVADSTFTVADAVQVAKDILFNNSNRVYGLDIDEQEAEDAVSSNPKGDILNTSQVGAQHSNQFKIAKLREIEKAIPFLAFVYVLWVDLMGTMRARILPIKQFRKVIETGGNIGISRGNTGTLQNDTFTPAVNTTGQINVHIDLATLRPTHRLDTLRAPTHGGEIRSSATVLSSWCDDEGNGIPVCPRGRLAGVLKEIEEGFGLQATIGFEIEVTFLSETDSTSYAPYTRNHAYATLTTEQWSSLDLLRDIYDGLAELGIEAQQFHAEAGLGQYEFILPPLPALLSIPALIQAKQCIQQIAYTRNLRATFHPQPLPGIGTALHAHISLSPVPDAVTESNFWGGVLSRLRAICAFTLPQSVSYKRVIDGAWTGGTWVAWGTQNREVPLRKVLDPGPGAKGARWEVRCLDGMGNIYLALAGVFAAGLLGLKDEKGLQVKDCQPTPSKITEAQRNELGITQRMPLSLEESIAELKADDELVDTLGRELVTDFLAMKGVEQNMLNDMSEQERHSWLVARY